MKKTTFLLFFIPFVQLAAALKAPPVWSEASHRKAKEASEKFYDIQSSLHNNRFPSLDAGVYALDGYIWRYGETCDPHIRRLVAETYILKGDALAKKGLTDEQCAAYSACVAHFYDERDPGVCVIVGEALLRKADLLINAEKLNGACVVYDVAIACYKDGAPPVFRDLADVSYFNKGMLLHQLGRHEEAQAAWEACGEHARDEFYDKFLPWAKAAIMHPYDAMIEQKKPKEALAELMTRTRYLRDDTPPAIKDAFARVLYETSQSLLFDKNWEPLCVLNNWFLESSKNNTEQNIRRTSDRLLMCKCFAWIALGRRDEAAALIGGLFDSQKTGDWHGVLHNAKFLAEQGFFTFRDTQPETAIFICDLVLENLRDDFYIDICSDPVSKALWHKGGVLEKLCRTEEALAVYWECAARFENHGNSVAKNNAERAAQQVKYIKSKR